MAPAPPDPAVIVVAMTGGRTNRLRPSVTVLAACFALLAGGAADGAQRAASAPTWTVTANPFRLVLGGNGTVRLGEAPTRGGPGGRLSYRVADGTYHTLTALESSTPVPGGTRYRVATDEPGRSATVSVRTTRTGLAVSLRLLPAQGVVTTFEAFTAKPSEHFLGGGERPGSLDLRGQALAIKASYTCKNTMPAPFFLSSAGYGVSLQGTAIASLAFPGADPATVCAGGSEPFCPLATRVAVVQLCSLSPTLDYRVFFGTPKAVVSAYARTIGRPIMPDPSLFQLIKWRDVVSGEAQVFEDVDKLRALHIPLGWVLIDNPWESGLCYGRLTFDPSRFPDPKRMIRKLHARGVRLMLWISPLVRRQWCSAPSSYAPESLLGGAGNAWTLDLTNPKTAATFQAGLQRLLGLGVDGFKADRGDEDDLERAPLANGSGTTVHNRYPLLYARIVAAAARAAGRPASFPTLVRAGTPGSSATVSGFWGGDQLGDFPGLVQAIHDGLSAGVAGYSTWGSDTGGYGNAPPYPVLTPELFVRWAQFSAVSPVFEVGGIGESATFWDFDPRTVSLFRQAVVLHYELFPYLYELARRAHATGIPIMRPLALEYPADPNAWSHDLEVLVGSDLLAAPVTQSAPAGDADASVYLPRGTWVDLARGTAVRGGRTVVRPTPLSELPLYLRAGAAIPFGARTPLLWPNAWPTDGLTMRGRGGWIYAPAAGTTFGSSAAYGRLNANERRGVVHLRLRGAPRQTQILVAGARSALVTVGGRVVPRAASAAALRAAAAGWTPVRAPFRGIVLKLAPVGGTVDVTLRLRLAATVPTELSPFMSRSTCGRAGRPGAQPRALRRRARSRPRAGARGSAARARARHAASHARRRRPGAGRRPRTGAPRAARRSGRASAPPAGRAPPGRDPVR